VIIISDKIEFSHDFVVKLSNLLFLICYNLCVAY
jgi:hypothetical protein